MRTVGRSIHRTEGIPKVLGQSTYVSDMKFDDCLYGRTVRSTVPHARIRKIHFREGIPWSDFVIVLPEDIPGLNAVTLIDTDQPYLADKVIQHVAEPLVLIAHPDRELLDRAVQNIEIDVDELPAIFTIEDSDRVFKSYSVQNGDPGLKWDEADIILDETYRTGPQEHLYIEPQSMAAIAKPGQPITVWGSMQCPYYVRKALVPLFGVPVDQIRIIQMETGGGFGGKEEYPNMIAGHTALLSWKAGGRPVKMIYDRREDMWATTKRHPSKTHIKGAFKRDGTLIALDINFQLDGGAYPTLSSVVLSRGTLHAWGPYRCDHTRVQSRVMMTNSNPYGAFRGFGAPQSIFAIELFMNRAAHELGIDPTDIRRRNFLRKGDRMPTGQVIKEEIDLEGLMEQALKRSDYDKKRSECHAWNQRRFGTRKGIGLSVFFHGSGFTGSGEVKLASQVTLRVTAEGNVEVLAANVEYGQGTNTVLSQIVAEVCNILPDQVVVHRPDTQVVPDSGPTVASRTTMIVGKLIERAARQLRDRIVQLAGLREGYGPEEFRDAVRRCRERYPEMQVTVGYEPPMGVYWNDETYQGDAYGGYAWCCDVAEIEVDLVEYSARVINFTSAVECGRVINPALARGQIEGGIAQGIGFALYEDVVMEQGAMKNNQYTNYIIPTSADTPDIEVDFVEFPFSNPGPFSAKGIGEMPIDGPAPAIASALGAALSGRFINEIPLVPERIMKVVSGIEENL